MIHITLTHCYKLQSFFNISTTFQRCMQLVAKLAECVVAGLVVRDDVDTVPRTARVLEEVITRVDGRVHCRQQTRCCNQQTC